MNQRHPQSRHTPHGGSEKPTQKFVFSVFELMGAPIGEAGFEEAYYAHKVSGSVSRVDETVS